MTVSSTPRRAGPYAINGITTDFSFDFKVFEKSDVGVVLTLSDGSYSFLTLDSDYSISLNVDQDNNPGGTVTYTGTGSTLTMLGVLDYEQDTDITNVGRFLPQVIENALDKQVILLQQILEVSNRTLQAAPGTAVTLAFPAPSSGKFIRWRPDLTGLENADASDNPGLQGILASGTGAPSIGYLQDAIPALPADLMTVEERLRHLPLSIVGCGAVPKAQGSSRQAFLDAITTALALGYRSIFVPPGEWDAGNATLQLALNDFYGVMLIGAGRKETTIHTSVTGTTPFMELIGGSGTYGNAGAHDFTVKTATDWNGTLIRNDGFGRADFQRIDAPRMKRGVWLHNNLPGNFTEFGNYDDLWIDECDETIRLEVGGGNISFRGNHFGVKGNIRGDRGQIFFNCVSGYWYNGTFRWEVTTNGSGCFPVKHEGNCTQNFGTLLIEGDNPATPGTIAGNGIFFAKGSYGGINMPTVTSNYGGGTPRFAFDDFIPDYAFVDAVSAGALPAGSLSRGLNSTLDKYNGLAPAMVAVQGANDQNSVMALISAATPNNNGFYVADLAANLPPGQARLLWRLGSGVMQGTSYSTGAGAGTIYNQWASRSLKGSGNTTVGYDDAVISVRREGLANIGDAFTHDAAIFFATNSSTRDADPVDRVVIGGTGIRPAVDNTFSCGTLSGPGGAQYRWASVVAVNGTIQTSDERLKTDITDIDFGLNLIRLIEPKTFRWKEGGKALARDAGGNPVFEEVDEPFEELQQVDSGETEEYADQVVTRVDGRPVIETVIRTRPVMVERLVRGTRKVSRPVYESRVGCRVHAGAIAQQVKAAMDSLGIDFGGWGLSDAKEPDSEQWLRPDQFVWPLMQAVQQLDKQVQDHATTVAALLARVEALEKSK